LLTDRYGVRPEHPTNAWENCEAQINDAGELDISNDRRGGWLSILAPTKVEALPSTSRVVHLLSGDRVSGQLE
ncbi:unnamed protein product, partial [Sphacelaria rigidula]